jgi:CDP-diacylglycerol---glycerol-3-phosphate 3-phosphatidyltransferase
VSSRPAATDAAGRGAVVALPNVLSLFRIGLVPVLVLALMRETQAARAFAGACFLVACITDFLDGWLARRHGITSALGELLDPLADKLIVAATLIMLAAMPPEPRVPAWMAVVIVLRELAVTGLRGIASSGGVLLPAQELGKYKMIFQMFAVEALLLHYAYPIPGTGLMIDFHAGGMVFLWVALVLAVWSGADYYVRILRQIRLD